MGPHTVLGNLVTVRTTLALLVVERTFDLLSLPRDGIIGVTMPGFGTTERTLQSARELARALGGRLELESTPGEGSRFELQLPTHSA